MSGERRELKASDRESVEEIIDEHFPFDCDIIPVDGHTWAIHGSIPVDGESILAEFSSEEDAEVALELLSEAEERARKRQ
jgi:hypothetical protein